MKDRLRGSKRASPLFYLIRIMPSQEVILIFSETLVHGRCFFYFIGNSEGTSYEIKGTACRRGTIFFNAILHNYDHGKEKMIEERKFNLNLT